MGKSADELRRDIEGTRADLSETLDAIGDRVSPSRMIQRRKNRFSERVTSVRERVMGVAEHSGQRVSDTATGAMDAVREAPQTMRSGAQGSPLLAGSLAFGAGFLVAAVLPPSEKEKHASTQLMEKAEPLKQAVTESARTVADDLKEPAREAAQEIKTAASDAARATKDTAKGAVSETTEQAETAAQEARQPGSGPQ